MNPIRTLIPAFLSRKFQYAWIYVFAPTIGMYLAQVLTKKWNQDVIK